tara:strand:+ start:36 stop:641 length:606 start_codon:yes stop_codon:yes gene_type:complete
MYYLVGCAALITGIYYYRYELGMKLLYTANEAIKSYHRLTNIYTKNKKEEKEDILEEKTISLLKYNKETYAKNLEIEYPLKIKKEELYLVNNGGLYKRIKTDVLKEEDLIMNKTDKLFIQIELKQNDKIYDIHEYIGNFYIENNEILDKVFLEWFMKEFYSTKLEDNYELNIIDKEINIFKLKKDEKVILTKESYKIEKCI